MSKETETLLNDLEKYERYDNRHLLREYKYLMPNRGDPWKASEALADMNKNDLAHLYAVCTVMAARLDEVEG